MVADFMKHHGVRIPVVGVLTDYAPHIYWMHETVDHYVVSSEAMKERFVSNGVGAERICVFGIPVEPRFLDPVDREAAYRHFGLEPHQPVVMVMGGGGGFGPIRELVRSLDRVPQPCQFVVLAGTNQMLLAWLRQQPFRHRVVASGYTDLIPDLMDLSVLIITKPGGLTTAEALAKHLPLMIVAPIPGQELCNARFLLSEGAAIELGDPQTAGAILARLLGDQESLGRMRQQAARLAHPDSALRTAQLLFALADRSRPDLASAAGVR
jgi:processive 1,2-diacylglycerol beta-glucosyltransferase